MSAAQTNHQSVTPALPANAQAASPIAEEQRAAQRQQWIAENAYYRSLQRQGAADPLQDWVDAERDAGTLQNGGGSREQ
jgi:hypothetical protein